MSYRGHADSMNRERVRQARERLERQGDPIGTRAAFVPPERDDAPTAQREARGDVQAPLIDRDTNRPYHRAVDEFDRLYQRGELEWCHKQAADKLKRHYMGSLGVNVATGEGLPPDERCEYPRTYHSQQVARAEAAVSPRQWKGLLILVTEQGRIEHVGGAACQVKCPKQARAAGRVLIQEALEVLARLWGMTTVR